VLEDGSVNQASAKRTQPTNRAFVSLWRMPTAFFALAATSISDVTGPPKTEFELDSKYHEFSRITTSASLYIALGTFMFASANTSVHRAYMTLLSVNLEKLAPSSGSSLRSSQCEETGLGVQRRLKPARQRLEWMMKQISRMLRV
jgi:hypothetical protein